MSTVDYSFGNWIKRRRKTLDLTQQELAQRVGCSISLIFKIESDERRPSRQIADLLATHLEIPSDQRALFLKVARQEKAVDGLEALSPLSAPRPAPVPRPRPGNIPIPPTTLIGREHEIAMVGRQLLDPACRLLTLTGPGGVGKTRLAIEAGHRLEPHFTDGVYFISMAGVGMTESIVPAIADALGLAFSGPAEPIVQVSNYLRTKEILLVVDNMEHLLEGGSLLGEMLQQTRHVRMLITSREPLRLQWEWLFEVQGLPVPEDTDANIESNSAITLFIQRARQTSQNFSLEAEDTAALVRICKLVGGLPLAIELAASWVRILSCREIALELERSLDLLETKKLDVPARHRSIKTVFDHSWTLLTDEERILLMRLSIFQGGFTREAAISAMGTSLSMLSSLVDKSLVRHRKDLDRYDLHELIQQHSFARLQSNPVETTQASEKYAVYYTNWVAALERPFKSAQQPQTSQQIRAETSNWLSSWHWAVKNHRLDLLRKMIPCLNWYFEVHGYYAEALSTFKTAVDGFRVHGAPANLQSAAERSSFAFLVDSLGWFEFRTGNVERATVLLAESLEHAREANDPEVMYYIHGNWGYLCLFTGDTSEAGRLTTESLVYGKALNSPWHIAIPISVLGIVAYQQGNLNEARQQLTESLKIWRSVGDPRGLVFCMLYLGMTTFALKDIPATRSILRESNAVAEANMDRWAHALGLDLLGMVSLSQGKNEEALAFFNQSLALSKEIGDQLNATQTAIHMGQAYVALRSNEAAKRLFLEAYTNARQAKWTPITLNALVSFVEMQNGLSAETKLAVALSVLSHPAVTPNLRARCEHMRDEMKSSLTTQKIEVAEDLAKEKKPEAWAQEILK
jgi:predicted ATPase/transcriptional regulator with XRE-family HTH domain